MKLRLLCASLVLSTACASGAELAVDVRTDYVAGVEFDAVRVTVDGAHEVPLVVVPHDDFADAAHVADYRDFPTGLHHVVVHLSLGRDPVATSDVWVRLNENVLVPVTITRTCSPLSCPVPSHPSATTCYGGQCFDPMCDPTDAACMADECSPGHACAQVGRCVDVVCDRGACLRLPRDERCASNALYCVPETGACAYLPGHGPPGAPVATAVASATAPEITVSWTDVGASQYVLQLSTDMTFPTAATTTTTTAQLQVVLGSLESGRRYYARVSATDMGAPWSNVVSAVTMIAGPTNVSLVVIGDGSSRLSTDPLWITPTDFPGMWVYVQGHGSATCASGTPEFSFIARYLRSPATEYPSGWQGPDSFIEGPRMGYSVRYRMTARCAGADAASAPSAEFVGCSDNGGGC